MGIVKRRKRRAGAKIFCVALSIALVSMATSKLVAAELVQSSLKSRTIVKTGSIRSFRNRIVEVGDNRKQRVGIIANKVFRQQNIFLRQMNRVKPQSRILFGRPKISEKAYETKDSFILTRTVSVVVARPRLLSRRSKIFRSYNRRSRLPRRLQRSLRPSQRAQALTPELRLGLAFAMKNVIPKLPANHPMKIAARQGQKGLLKAIVAGKGDLSITDTIVIPKRTIRLSRGSIKLPVFTNGTLNFKRMSRIKSPLLRAMAVPAVDISTRPTMRTLNRNSDKLNISFQNPGPFRGTSSGQHNFNVKMLAGFTRAHSWEWERKWTFWTGYLRVNLSAGYALGLRIPMQIDGKFSYNKYTVISGNGAHIVRTRVRAKTLDASADFYRQTGLASNLVVEGKEMVLEANASLSITLKAAYKTWPTKKFGKEFTYSRNFAPPFAGRGSVTLPIPTAITRTEFTKDLGVASISGYGQLGLKIAGNGTLKYVHQKWFDGAVSNNKNLTFTSYNYKTFQDSIPAIPNGMRQVKYGFKISDPKYRINFTITPQVRFHAGLAVAMPWGVPDIDKSFDVAWMSLNALTVNLGSLTFNAHEGTKIDYTYRNGVKSHRPKVAARR